MTDTVENRWRELLARGEPELREVDAESPLRMLIGVSPVGRPYFAVIVSEKPGLPDLTNAIEVTRRQRAADGRWTLTLELQVHALTDAFISLVSDLGRPRARPQPTSERRWRSSLRRLPNGRSFSPHAPTVSSESALRGLIAELWFGFESEAHGHPVPEAARAWAGPLGGAQDFQFPAPWPSLRDQVVAAES